LRRLSRPTLACLAVCAVVLGVAAVDFAHVQTRVPPLPPADCGVDVSCNDARNAEIADRRTESSRLEEQYESRAWLYSFAIIAAISVATAVALRTRRRKDWPRVFTNVGIAGAWSAIGATLIVLLTDGEVVALPSGAVYAPAVALIGAAAVGTVLGRAQDWSETDAAAEARAGAAAIGKRTVGGFFAGSRKDAAARFFTAWAAGLTALTVILALVFIESQPGCPIPEEGPPAWTDTLGAIVGISAMGAIAAGVGALLLRRWIPALATLVANPFAMLFLAASTCVFS
jgi:hypothetical protein